MKSLFPSEDKSVLRGLGALSPVLSCIRSITDSDERYSELKPPKVEESSFRFLKNEECVRNGNGFGLAISLQDGTTIFFTNSISTVLGYPKDMILGTNLMSFMYPRDQVTFTNHLALGLHSRFDDYNRRIQSDNTFYCRLRQYHSLKCGYGVSDKKNVYKPFKISIRLQDVPSEDSCVENAGQTTCLVALAECISSSYTKPEEIPAMSSFSTRHTASCHFSHMDSAAISYLGYLPQDVLGFSIFDFYHMDDMPQLKDIYELVVKEQGNSFRSKPYRLKAFNGSYVVLETEWSCFINPWSRKLEFVLGQHRVLKGPLDPKIFSENNKEDGVVSDEILKESQRIQHEIKTLLEQPVKNHISNNLRGRCPKRKRGLASFVSSLVDVCQGEEQNWAKEDCSCSDHGSVVMGEISPHQEFNDSDPSSVTPPTSQEIRYQENIDRFFASHPKTYSSDGSGETKTNFNNRHTCNMSVESGKTSAESGIGSMPTQSVTSLNAVNNSQGGSSRGSGEKYPSCISLTEELLTQHNRMIHKYNNKQRKVKTSSSTNVQLRKDSHRMKRSSSPHLPDGGHKHNKPSKSRAANVPTQTEDSTSNEQSNPSTGLNPMSGFSMNPPFSMGSFPSMSHTSSSTPWNSSSVTSSYNNNQAYNAGVPNYGVPNYLYMGGATGGPPSPFFMPVMYLGAMPFYPSIPPMLAQTTPTGMWPFNFGPACSMGLSVPVTGVNQPGNNPQATNGAQQQQQQQQQSQTQHQQQQQQSQTQHQQQQTQNGHPVPTTTSGGNGTVQTTPTTVNSKATIRQPYENMDTHNHRSSSVINNNNKQTRPETPMCQVKNIRTDNVRGNNNNNMNNLETKVSCVVTSGITTSTTATQCRNSTSNKSTCARVEDRTYLTTSGSSNDQDMTKDSEGEKDLLQDDSTSFSSSFLLKSDDMSSGSPSERLEEMDMDLKDLKKRPMLKDPPWMDGINLDSQTIYRFQLPSRTMEDVLKKDMEALRNMTQPDLVGKQLAQLQSELTNAAREMQEERTESQSRTSEDQEQKAGPSKEGDDTVQPMIVLGFDTLEEDTNEESDSREADILLNYAGTAIE